MVKDTEVMKFGGYCLDATDLCPLTAYAVAWTDEMPFTRFIKVVTPY